MNNKNKHITVKDASICLGIPLKTTYRLIKQRKIASIKIGGRIKCLYRDVERIKNEGTNSSTDAFGSNAGMLNRRTSQRINSNIRCHYSIDLTPFKEIINKGIIKNISTGGVFIAGNALKEPENINVDDPADIRFGLDLPGEKGREIFVAGRVIRKSSGGVAVKFRHIGKFEKEQIKKYVG
ncbi:PilZ domain-containing protein [Candidatus Omnitrophota bacterium]